MRIHWAVFGERNSGHALLATSANRQIAAKITQFTDRPGDPPHGLEWGPVVSGFYFADHYILLRTLPDTSVGRAGMVRSYVAFLPAIHLASIGNLKAVFNALPSDLAKKSGELSPFEIDDHLLQTVPAETALPGLGHVARELCSPNPSLPLVWSLPDPYLPTVDAVWAKLPVTLRTAFAFSFQFAPEHNLPVPPTVVATLPGLASRWRSAQLISSERETLSELSTAQKWFSGAADGKAFSDVLRDYGMTVREFKDLDVLSSFVDLVSRLPALSLAEARRAVRILEKYSRPSETLNKERAALFNNLCDRVLKSSAEDMQKLRNLDPHALSDLTPLLQDTIYSWMESAMRKPSAALDQIQLLELAVTTPESWWSLPFIRWMRNLAKAVASPEILCRIVFASRALTEFTSPDLPGDEQTENKLASELPAKLRPTQSEIILALAEQRGWTYLHAACLLRTRPHGAAIAAHTKLIDRSTRGLDYFFEEVGFAPLFEAACDTDSELLDKYVGKLLPDNRAKLPNNPGQGCARWLPLLAHAVKESAGQLAGALRDLVVETLEAPSKDRGGKALLAEACCDYDVSVFLSVNKPGGFLEGLVSSQRAQIVSKINIYVADEIQAGRPLKLADADYFKNVLDVSTMLRALNAVPTERMAGVGVRAFQNLPFLSDADCKQWLIELFTKTQKRHLDATACEEIASLLMSRTFPVSAKIVQDTVEEFRRNDVAPVLEAIRYKYHMAQEYGPSIATAARLLKVLIATALPLERKEVVKHLASSKYHPDRCADVGYWPREGEPIFEVFVIITGEGNLDAQRTILRMLGEMKPKFAFFLGVGGGIKDSKIGDVTYSRKVYYIEGGKEEEDGIKARPICENTNEKLVQLAHRVAEKRWQPDEAGEGNRVKATPAVIASGEKVLASTSKTATTYCNIKTSYNDTQVIDMEAFGFLAAFRDSNVKFKMVIRGVSDQLQDKAETDSRGSQPEAARNAAAFLFALLEACPSLLPAKKKRRNIFMNLFSDPNALP